MLYKLPTSISQLEYCGHAYSRELKSRAEVGVCKLLSVVVLYFPDEAVDPGWESSIDNALTLLWLAGKLFKWTYALLLSPVMTSR